MILRSDFRGQLCEEKGENKNSRAVNRPEAGVCLQLKLVRFGPSKNNDFW